MSFHFDRFAAIYAAMRYERLRQQQIAAEQERIKKEAAAKDKARMDKLCGRGDTSFGDYETPPAEMFTEWRYKFTLHPDLFRTIGELEMCGPHADYEPDVWIDDYDWYEHEYNTMIVHTKKGDLLLYAGDDIRQLEALDGDDVQVFFEYIDYSTRYNMPVGLLHICGHEVENPHDLLYCEKTEDDQFYRDENIIKE